MTVIRVGGGLLLAACLATAQLGWIHRDKRHPKKKDHAGEGVLGVVVRVSPDSFVIRAVDTRLITFKLAESTLYFHGPKWVGPGELLRGAAVGVDATADHDGILTATNVVFQDSQPVLKLHPLASTLLPGGVSDDPLVAQAREASDTFFQILPNFICQQSTTRSYSSADKRWRTLDRVTAEVLYDHGHESYRDVKLNGRSTGHSMMDLPGSRSTGEFGSTLRALFDKETAALFRYEANATLDGFSTSVYDFAVSGDQSDWRISAGSQTIMTSYTGKIWIDENSGNVVRIEMQAVDIPETFPFRVVEATVDYGPVVLPLGRYFLPVKAENLSCQNDPYSCSRNVIEFRNYHKYVGESTISYDSPETAEPKH